MYSSKYEAILKIILLYLVERYGGMLSRFDFLLGTARPFGLFGAGGAVFSNR